MNISSHIKNVAYSSHKFQPRRKELLALEGTVVATLEGRSVPYEIQILYGLLCWSKEAMLKRQTDRGESIFKWLKKQGYADERLQDLQTRWVAASYPLTLSCRYRDILRCSMTDHFMTCYSPTGMNSHKPVQLCANPDVAICGFKARNGDYIARTFVQWTPTGYIFGLKYNPVSENLTLNTTLPLCAYAEKYELVFDR